MCICGVFRNHYRFHNAKEGKVMDPNNIEALVNIPTPITPQEIQVFNGMP